MNCANWRNSRIGARPKPIFTDNDLQLLLEPT